MKKVLYFIIAIVSVFISCSREGPEDEIIGSWKILIGRWKFIDQYDGYYNGGNFQWNPVPAENQDVYEFTSDNLFFEYLPYGEIRCTGSYLMISNNEVQINSSCYIGPFTLDFSIEKDTMLITHFVTEGQIIEKFLRDE